MDTQLTAQKTPAPVIGFVRIAPKKERGDTILRITFSFLLIEAVQWMLRYGRSDIQYLCYL